MNRIRSFTAIANTKHFLKNKQFRLNSLLKVDYSKDREKDEDGDKKMKSKDVASDMKFIEKRLKDLQTNAAELLKQMKEKEKDGKNELDSTPYWKFLKQMQAIDRKSMYLPIEEITANVPRVMGDNIYKIGFDYPGFRAKDLRVSLCGHLLRIEACKESKEDKNFVYQNTCEELLPPEADLNNVKVFFDAVNGFLIIETPLPVNANIDEIRKHSIELNEELQQIKKDSKSKHKDSDKKDKR